MGQGWPTVTTLGTAPERGKLSAAKPGCRARFLFGYFLFRASKEKVTRRKGETSSGGNGENKSFFHFFHWTSQYLGQPVPVRSFAEVGELQLHGADLVRHLSHKQKARPDP
jgi:hypothetical protein